MNFSCAKYEVKAFTLLELLTGMIVSAIVLGATFSAWKIISRQSMRYEEQADRTRELSLLHSRFVTDMANSDSTYDDGTTMSAYKRRHADMRCFVRYTFEEEYTLRVSDNHTDTFHVTAFRNYITHDRSAEDNNGY